MLFQRVLNMECMDISDAMVVKEIVQGLVDDNMVDTERIGTSNYFWAFPSKAMNAVSFLMKNLTLQQFIDYYIWKVLNILLCLEKSQVAKSQK